MLPNQIDDIKLLKSLIQMLKVISIYLFSCQRPFLLFFITAFLPFTVYVL
jgi:hypothetical protein